MLLSLLVHAMVVAGAVVVALLTADPLPAFEVYRVELVSPPPTEAGQDQPTPPEPEPVVVPAQEEAQPEPELLPEPERPQPPAAEPREPEPERPPQPSRGPEPDPESAGGENLEVRIDGEDFSDPAYLENIIRQNRRYFRWTGDPGLRACVYFEILRDGGTRGIRIVRGSGNFRFDLAARGAVEAAGSRKAYGELPAHWPHDLLPVQFSFSSNRLEAC
ncbi:MAG TPA: TonB C-terminal domain-containing protein [Longimicrobiales bacterium]|nr:TonB C-terminal domain-containing protein [Longimicrobiales bacterium]